MGREIEDIKTRLNLVEIVQEYLPLKKAGSNFRGLCPFHQEKSPSFMVSETKQIWHCFGCHKGGDMFSFVQEVEGLEFFETLKLLAQKAGITITEQTARKENKKQPLLNVLETTANFFHEVLLKHPKAQSARDYVAKRQLKAETVRDFKLGYAPDTWDALLKYLQGQGFSVPDIIASGVVVSQPEQNKLYDRFRHRLIIPLSDAYGAIVGFTARALAEDFVGGKYINTPQTEVYDKSSVVFGLDKARLAIKEADYVVIVEGNLDVISSHQAGIRPVVGVSGTAFTEKQVAILKRYTNNFIFSFDADQAGQMAQRRSMLMVLRAKVNIKILLLPQGKDPDECIKQDVNLWTTAIAQALPLMEYLFVQIKTLFDLSALPGKKAAADYVLEILQALPNPVEKDFYLNKLSAELGISEQSLVERMSMLTAKQRPATGTKDPSQAREKTAPGDPLEQARYELLALLLVLPPQKDQDLTSIFADSAWLTLYKDWQLFYNSDNERSPEFAQIQMFADAKFADLDNPEKMEEFNARCHFIKQQVLKNKLEQVRQQLQKAEAQQDQALIAQFTQESALLLEQLLLLG